MKQMQITDRDWAQLSAYLDGELSGRELRRVRKKIQTDPLLKAALEELKLTKQFLQTVPQIPAPRNFTLTPEMIGVKSKKPSFPGYRLAAALTSFLLIGVLILDFGGINFKGVMSAEHSPNIFDSQPESIPEAAADTAQEPMILEAVGEVAEEQAVAEYEKDPTAVETLAIEAPVFEEEAVEETLAEGISGEEPEEKTLDSAVERGNNRVQDGDDPTSTTQVLSSQTPEPPPIAIEYFSDDEIQGPGRSPGISTLRILEILFGLGVIGFSAAAWIKRKNNPE